MWLLLAGAVALAQDRFALTPKTEPQVLDFTAKGGLEVGVPLDGSVDLAAFVCRTDEGDIILDELIDKWFGVAYSETGPYLKYELKDIYISSYTLGGDSGGSGSGSGGSGGTSNPPPPPPPPPPPMCITIMSVQFCTPA